MQTPPIRAPKLSPFRIGPRSLQETRRLRTEMNTKLLDNLPQICEEFLSDPGDQGSIDGRIIAKADNKRKTG